MQTTGTLAMPWLLEEDYLNADTLRRIEELRDLLRYRIPVRGLEQTIVSLRADVWELRMIILDRHFNELKNNSRSDLQSLLKDFTSEQDQFADAIQHALTVYRATVSSITEKLNIDGGFQFPADMDIPHSTLDLLLSKVPNWNFQYLLAWINSSIDLDSAMLTLHTHRQAPIIGLEGKSMVTLLKTSGEYFGAYAEVLGFWKAPLQDAPQPIHNARILAAALRAKVAPGKKYDLENLQKQFAA